MRLIPLFLSLFTLLLGLVYLPGLWTPERDLGILSQQYLEANGAEKLGTLSIEERNELIRREMDVLRVQPLESASHRNLALLSLLPPATEASRNLILNLSRYSLRNPAQQMAATGVLLEAKNLPEAIYRVDAVLRAQPELSAQLYPLIAQNFADKIGMRPLADTLASDPPWRAGFLTYLADQPIYERFCLDLIRELRATASPAKTSELQRIFASWIKSTKSYGKSYFVWLDQLSADQLRHVKMVYDGEFTTDPQNLYFDWNITSTRNGRSSIVLKPGSSTDRALLVDFVGNKDPFQNVSQYLQLTPGAFTLSFEVMSKNLIAEKGLVWRLSCVGRSEYLAESAAIKSSTPWSKLNVKFQVPTDQCDTQLLRLETKALSGLDTSTAGQIYFDSIVVTPAESSATPEQ